MRSPLIFAIQLSCRSIDSWRTSVGSFRERCDRYAWTRIDGFSRSTEIFWKIRWHSFDVIDCYTMQDTCARLQLSTCPTLASPIVSIASSYNRHDAVLLNASCRCAHALEMVSGQVGASKTCTLCLRSSHSNPASEDRMTGGMTMRASILYLAPAIRINFPVSAFHNAKVRNTVCWEALI